MPALRVDQINQLRDIFARFDMDSDGSLTILELTTLLRSLGLKSSGDQVHVLLANMDANGNGSVEFDGLVSAILPDMDEEIMVNQKQLLEVFRSFEHDGNGYIEVTETIKEADTDGDSVISFNDFATIMAKLSSFLGLAAS
ncbi:unnamed protein product [Malus baccata var. baccata]